jgi:hypothetical protein
MVFDPNLENQKMRKLSSTKKQNNNKKFGEIGIRETVDRN